MQTHIKFDSIKFDSVKTEPELAIAIAGEAEIDYYDHRGWYPYKQAIIKGWFCMNWNSGELLPKLGSMIKFCGTYNRECKLECLVGVYDFTPQVYHSFNPELTCPLIKTSVCRVEYIGHDPLVFTGPMTGRVVGDVSEVKGDLDCPQPLIVDEK
jgi:hypothetical protein